MLSTEFTPIAEKTVIVPSSGFVSACMYLLVTNEDQNDPRVVTFFVEIGSFQSPPRTIEVGTEGSKLSIIPVQIPSGEYTASLFAKADMADRINIISASINVK